MITCPACSKQNQDHYRFCLGCGAELPRGAASNAGAKEPVVDENTDHGHTTSAASEPPPKPMAPPKEVTDPPPPIDVAPAPQPEPVEDAGMPPGKCPECGYVNPPTNRFCASCGFRLEDAAHVAPSPAAVEESDTSAILVALDPEGNEVGRYHLPHGETMIGRNTGGIFETDTYLSPTHAVFNAEGGRITVRDAESLNGVFRKLLAEQRSGLHNGQRFRIGQELLQFDALDPASPDGHGVSSQGSAIEGFIGRISLVVGRETVRPSYPMPDRGMNLGRERGEVLFPDDGYVSGLHCHLSYENGDVFVTDLGSSNGTFVQLTEEVELRNGDVLLMGQQLFRVTI